MRVLHVLHSLDQRYGGPIRAVLDLSARSEADLESEILGFGALNIPDNPLPCDRIHSLPVRRPRSYCYAPQLRRWVAENISRFDGVVLHGMWLYPNRVVAQACLRRGIPYACFPHGMLEPWAVFHQGLFKTVKKTLYWRLWEKRIFDYSRCVFFTTEREKQMAQRTFPLRGLQLLLMPYGIDVNRSKVAQPSRAEILQPPDRKIALFLGRLHPKKNVDLLIKAWAAANLPDNWTLVIAGSGDRGYTERLRRLIASLNLEKRIQLAGFVSGRDKAYLLQRAAWFMLPSNAENFGVAVIEAVTHGCAVAVSDKVCIADALDENSGVLPVETEAWTDFMRTRMTDERVQKAASANNLARLQSIMNIDKVASDWAATLGMVFGR